MDARYSRMLAWGAGSLVLVAVCFSAGYLLMSAPPPAPPAEAAIAPESAAPPAPSSPLHRYNLTIDTTADWTRVRIEEGRFVQGNATGLNAVDISSAAPAQMSHLLYAPGEIFIEQKPFATARIVLKCVVESPRPMLEVHVGHGDNGAVKISSPVDSFTNDRILGDGQNFVTGAVRLE